MNKKLPGCVSELAKGNIIFPKLHGMVEGGLGDRNFLHVCSDTSSLGELEDT